MTASLILSVQAENLSDAEVADITRELSSWITKSVPGVRASSPSPTPSPGEKGAVELGTLLLALINAGAATALVNCLATYIKERRKTVKLEVSSAAGESLTFAAENVDASHIDSLVRQLSRMAEQTATTGQAD